MKKKKLMKRIYLSPGTDGSVQQGRQLGHSCKFNLNLLPGIKRSMFRPVLDIDTIIGKDTCCLQFLIVFTIVLRKSPSLGNVDLKKLEISDSS